MGKEAAAGSSDKKTAPGLLRMQKDASELNFDAKKDGITINFHNGPEDLMNFKLDIEPMSGLYKGGKFTFDIKVPPSYPHDRPRLPARRRFITQTLTWRATCA